MPHHTTNPPLPPTRPALVLVVLPSTRLETGSRGVCVAGPHPQFPTDALDPLAQGGRATALGIVAGLAFLLPPCYREHEPKLPRTDRLTRAKLCLDGRKNHHAKRPLDSTERSQARPGPESAIPSVWKAPLRPRRRPDAPVPAGGVLRAIRQLRKSDWDVATDRRSQSDDQRRSRQRVAFSPHSRSEWRMFLRFCQEWFPMGRERLANPKRVNP